MTLKEYRDKYKLRNADLARIFKTTTSCVHHWVSGHAKPNHKNAVMIYKKTNKEVTLEDLGIA